MPYGSPSQDVHLAVKQNRGTLYENTEHALADALDTSARVPDISDPLVVESSESVSKGDGRVETRATCICWNLSWLTTGKRSEGLSAIAMTEATRQHAKSDKIKRHGR